MIGAATVLFSQAQPQAELSQFESWKATYGVKYESMFEESYREKVFLENIAKMNLHNMNQHNTYKMGINQFSALTDEEFVQTYLGTIAPTQNIVEESADDISVGDVDWTSQGAVTPIKNQGQCGSCWAFSTTGALEGLSKIAYGSLQSFSEQQLVDCSGKYGNMACNGGLMDNAFKFVRDNGIVHEDEYPYKAVKQTCSKATGDFKISGFTDIKNCNDLANALTGRPISIAVDATNWSRYSSGVFNNCSTRLNHGVLLVGVTDQYWRVKNSWSASWGEQGFIRLARGNTCGMCNAASYPNK
jgi:C1A family cysteine protease